MDIMEYIKNDNNYKMNFDILNFKFKKKQCTFALVARTPLDLRGSTKPSSKLND